MNWRRAAFWFGVLALADAMLLVAPFGLPLDGLAEAVPRAVVPLLALVAAGYGVTVLATAGGDPPARRAPVTTREEPTSTDRVGADIDAALDALDTDDESPWTRANARRMLRSELRRSAVAALSARGHSREEAERLLDAGAWTDDRRAAAFLGGEHLPLSVRIRDWASGEGARRRAEAAVEALADLTEHGAADGPVSERPDRRPAGELFGDGLEAAPATAEREAEVEA